MPIVSGSADSNNEVLITIPAGMYWRGSVSISGSLTAQAGVGSQQSIPTVTVDDSSGGLQGQVITGLSITTPVVNILSLLGVTSNSSVCQSGVTIQAPPSNSITFKLLKDGATQVIAVANGVTSSS